MRTGLWLAAIVVGSFLFQGYVVGIINHGLQVPLLRHYAGDTAFAHDTFIQDIVRTYTTAFYPVVGNLARVVPLRALLLALFLLCRAGTAWLACRLALALWSDRQAALWTAAALCIHTVTFAQDTVSDVYLTHGAVAQVMTLGSLVLLARGRVIAAFVLAGVMFGVHAMHATHLIGVMALAVLLGPRRRADLRHVVTGAAVAALLAAPTLWWMWRAGVLGAPVPDDYARIIRGWFPPHFWPSTWGVMDWVALLFPALAAWPLWRLAGPGDDGGVTARVALASLVLGFGGGLLTEIVPHPFLIRLHPMRMAWLMTLAGAPLLCRAGVQLLRGDTAGGRDATRLATITGALLLLGLAVSTLYRCAYWLGLVPALWALALAATRGRVSKPGTRTRVFVATTLVLAAAIPAAHLWSNELVMTGFEEARRRLRLFVLAEGAVGAAAAGLVVWAFATRARGDLRGSARRAVVWFICIIAAAHLLTRGAFVAHMRRRGPLAAWVEVQRWAAAHLPAGERVLVPLAQIGFRTFSNQVPAVDFQEGDALFHSPAYAPVFTEKLRLYGWQEGPIFAAGHITRLDALDRRLDADGARRIGEALGASVAVRRALHPPWPLPELHRNRYFVVYQLRP